MKLYTETIRYFRKPMGLPVVECAVLSLLDGSPHGPNTPHPAARTLQDGSHEGILAVQ